MRLARVAIIALLFCTVAGVAQAKLIDFEDLYPGYEAVGPMPTDYQGFDWSDYAGWYTKHAVYPPGSGYEYTCEGNVALFTSWSMPISMSGETFDFVSCKVGSAWYETEQVLFEGYKGGELVYQKVVTTNNTGGAYFTFNFYGIDTVVVYPQDNENGHVILDNILVGSGGVAADAGPDQRVEQTSPSGAEVTLDGSGSTGGGGGGPPVEVTGVIKNPSFEEGTAYWDLTRADYNLYSDASNYGAGTMPTDGDWLLWFSGCCGYTGSACERSQTVDLTGIDTITFDAELITFGAAWHNNVKAKVLVDDTIVWEQGAVGPYGNQSVSVSSFEGEHALRLRVYVTNGSGYLGDAQYIFFDNFRTWRGGGGGGGGGGITEVIDFENLYPGYESYGDLPDGYEGFQWSEDADWYTKYVWPGSPYEFDCDGSVAILTAYANPVSFSGSPFDLVSARIVPVWWQAEEVVVEGYRDGELVDTRTINATALCPTTYDWALSIGAPSADVSACPSYLSFALGLTDYANSDIRLSKPYGREAFDTAYLPHAWSFTTWPEGWERAETSECFYWPTDSDGYFYGYADVTVTGSEHPWRVILSPDGTRVTWFQVWDETDGLFSFDFTNIDEVRVIPHGPHLVIDDITVRWPGESGWPTTYDEAMAAGATDADYTVCAGFFSFTLGPTDYDNCDFMVNQPYSRKAFDTAYMPHAWPFTTWPAEWERRETSECFYWPADAEGRFYGYADVAVTGSTYPWRVFLSPDGTKVAWIELWDPSGGGGGGTEVTGVIKNPSFEEGTAYWDLTHQDYDLWSDWVSGGPYGSMPTDGANFLYVGGAYSYTGNWCERSQVVDLTGIDTITFDAEMWTFGVWHDNIKGKVLIDDTIVWEQGAQGSFSHQSVSVSHLSGEHTLRLRVYVTSADGYLGDAEYVLFDNFRTWRGGGGDTELPGLIKNPSFEEPADWMIVPYWDETQTGPDLYSWHIAGDFGAMPTDGLESLYLGGAYNAVEGSVCERSQVVDLTGVSKITFDAELWAWATWDDVLKAQFAVDGTVLWEATARGSHLNQSIDVSGLSGPHALQLRAVVRKTGGYYPDGHWVFFDNLRAWQSGGGGGGALSYEWREGDTVLGNEKVIHPTLNLGHHVITLTVADQNGNSDCDEVVVDVVDTTPPELSVSGSPVYEQDSAAGASIGHYDVEVTASDVCDTDLDITFDPPEGSVLSLGTHTITVTATDDSGNPTSAQFTLTVRDTTDPVIAELTATPGTLWPPLHQMVDVAVTAVCSDICDIDPVCQIVEVTSNEPTAGPGTGNDIDWIVTGPMTLQLRSERLTNSRERIYTIRVTCTDDSGNVAERTVEVRVKPPVRK